MESTEPRRRVWRDRILSPAVWAAPAVARLKCRLPASQRSRDVIHVIGDSHVAVFSGTEAMVDAWPHSSRDATGRFRTYRLGPVLAYRLSDLGTTTRGREKLLLTLAYGPVPPRGTVMLSFGEIDCRYHLPRQADIETRDIEEIVSECVDRYARVVLDVKGMGFRACVWGVVPSNDADSGATDSEYPSWGTAQQRNHASRTFNRLLTDRLEPQGVPVIVIFDQLMGADDLPKREYYTDAVHLSPAALSMAIAAIDAALG